LRRIIRTDVDRSTLTPGIIVEGAEQWLSGEAGKEILGPFPAEEMAARVISKRINKPENPSVLEEDEIEQGERLI
jgi:hypothetical protein